MISFDDLWRVYPHYQQRSKKAVSRAIFQAIITTGRTTKVDGLELTHQAEADVVVNAAKAFHMQLIRERTPASGENRDFVPGLQVWLNQGRFEDLDDADRVDLSTQYDEHKARVTERGLRLVK